MEAKLLHSFLSACLSTHSNACALADYITCDSAFSTSSELICSLLREPIRIRLVVCAIGDTFRISVYLTESIRITSGFLEKTGNAVAIEALLVLLEKAPEIFTVCKSNPVLRTTVYEELIGKNTIKDIRQILAQLTIHRHEKYVSSISHGAVHDWKNELQETLSDEFRHILDLH